LEISLEGARTPPKRKKKKKKQMHCLMATIEIVLKAESTGEPRSKSFISEKSQRKTQEGGLSSHNTVILKRERGKLRSEHIIKGGGGKRLYISKTNSAQVGAESFGCGRGQISYVFKGKVGKGGSLRGTGRRNLIGKEKRDKG